MIKYKNVKTISVSDWDKLVVETYGKPYNFQQQDGCQDRGRYTITIPDDESYNEEMNENIPFEVNGDERGVQFETWLRTTPEQIKEENPDLLEYQYELFWDRNFYPDIQMVANDLHSKGLIEAGDYVIDIDW